MKRKLLILFLFVCNNMHAQCPIPVGLFASNITSSTALANWSPVVGADHYKIHYRILGTSTWSNLGNINANDSTRNVPLLQQGTTYEWEIKAYCDSTNQMGSLWSIGDTFTTVNFVPAIFNPISTSSLSSEECNTTVDLKLSLVQSNNEPDIDNTLTTSDGGYFNIASLSINDTIGYSTLNTSSQNITCVLKVGFIAGQNYAIVNSVDSADNLIGFFSIQNESGGIKIRSTSPNDGNNYTSGFSSNMSINGVFVTPNSAGPLTFYTIIESELGDINNYIDIINISCNTAIEEKNYSSKKEPHIYNLLGKKSKEKSNEILIYRNASGSVIKRLTIE